jgi:hypothetical protein
VSKQRSLGPVSLSLSLCTALATSDGQQASLAGKDEGALLEDGAQKVRAIWRSRVFDGVLLGDWRCGNDVRGVMLHGPRCSFGDYSSNTYQ